MKRQPPIPLEHYELWQDAEDYVLLTENHSQKESLLRQPANLLTVISAATWEDACHERDRYLGWGGDPRDRL